MENESMITPVNALVKELKISNNSLNRISCPKPRQTQSQVRSGAEHNTVLANFEMSPPKVLYISREIGGVTF